ncbi:P2X purinoceptor 5-like [Lampetra planeri]
MGESLDAKALCLAFFDYKTEKFVIARNKKVGVLYRLLQLGVIGYLLGYACRWVFVVKRGYQEWDSALESSVITKLKGVTLVNASEGGTRVWDVADYVIPPQGENVFFVVTNLIVTPLQRQSKCPEHPKIPGALCTEDKECPAGEPLSTGNGIRTGRCVPHSPGIRTCEISAWCPVENATAPRRPVLAGAENFTVFIKNTIRFPKFDFSKRNVLERAEAAYLKRCRYNATAAPYCPIFRLGQLVRAAGEDFHSLAVEGGVIGVQIEWSCNLDRPASECHPVYSFNRLDAARPHLNASSSSGYNFRFAKYYRQADGGEQRKLFKVYGIRFDVLVFGKAGKFSIVPTAVNVGSGLALLGAGAFFCDLVLLYLSKRSPFYREKKYEEAKFQRGESVQMGMKRDSVTIATII